jgi:hypothetical protein
VPQRPRHVAGRSTTDGLVIELDDDLLQDHFLGRDRVAGHIHRHELQPIA